MKAGTCVAAYFLYAKGWGRGYTGGPVLRAGLGRRRNPGLTF